MGKKITYFKDVWAIRYVGFWIIPVILAMHNYYFFVKGNVKVSMEMGLFLIILYIGPILLSIRLRNRKVAVDEIGNVCISGGQINSFETNTYIQGRTNKYFQFNKENIKKDSIVPYESIKKVALIERLYLCKTKKPILIEFKKPLKFSGYMKYSTGFTISKMPDVKKLYVSLENPEEFLNYLKH
jgi:hypothetical protein